MQSRLRQMGELSVEDAELLEAQFSALEAMGYRVGVRQRTNGLTLIKISRTITKAGDAERGVNTP